MNSLNEQTLPLAAEGVEDVCLDRGTSSSRASSTACSSKTFAGVGVPSTALTPAELRVWREGYQAYLESKGVPLEGAADMAEKVAYRADLYPVPGITSDLFQLTPVARASELAAPAVEGNKDNLSGKGKSETAQLPAPIRRKPTTASTTAREAKLVKTAVEIAAERPSGDDLAFMHAIMCQVGLPRSRTDAREFLRKSGDFWLYVQAGMIDEGAGPVPQPVPYGPLPRLALVWLSSYAVRHRVKEIPIGHSAAEFLRLVGIEGDDGRRYRTLRKQMHALASCRLQLGYKGRTSNPSPVVKQFDAWVQNRSAGQRALWPGVLLLHDDYFSTLLESAVPLDNRALQALKGSALALDVYTWLAHRLHRIEGRPLRLYWKSLREQFAQEYKGKEADKDFKKNFLPALRAVQAVYPRAKVQQVTGGLLLYSSPPPVPYKGK
ncbi:replication protein RepA [Paraburkholderia guartelaensis]|uniref:replication protein RepA n=1 Tax=Paraburkholderia guartelaensis TaxID=2546446 RepID=UPI002AB6E7B1|nr:replication protein RepA [Paraburkholderia guartelaensis]